MTLGRTSGGKEKQFRNLDDCISVMMKSGCGEEKARDRCIFILSGGKYHKEAKPKKGRR